MKKISIFFASFVILCGFVFSSSQGEYYSYSYARLSYVNGDVYIQRAGDQGFEEGVVNLVLVEGDKLGTREGRAEIHFGRKNYLRINHDTQVDLISLPERGDDSIKLHLLSGEIYLRVNYLESEKDFEIHTPDASFYILEEGLYYVNVNENRETKFTVHQGTAEAAGEEDSLLIRSRESVVATDGYIQPDPVSSPGYYEDNFADWNRSRDARYSRVSTRRYLPEELYEYEAELADNGRWVYERSYGYVWVPTVYHYHDWRPYYYGRWVWYPIIGWNWVSYEPWGWSVYHYGRWHWRIGLGWYWIPTRYWGPSWVHWYWGRDYIGWCPLSYYGYPVVIVNNHFYGRYYDRYYPLHSRALTVIHRNQLQARRISKVALSRNQMTRLGKISLSAKQPGIKPVRNADRMVTAKAKKVLSRSSLRQVSEGFESERASPLSSSNKIRSQSLSRVSAISRSSGSIRSDSVGKKKLSSSTSTSRTPERRSSLSGTVSKTSRGSLTRIDQNIRSRSSLKTYPSRRNVSSFSKSRSVPSSSLKGVSRSSTRELRRESSVKNYSSRDLLGSRSSSSSVKTVSRGLMSPSRGSKATVGRVKSYPSSSRSLSRNSRDFSSSQQSRMTSKTYYRSNSSSGMSYYRSRSSMSSRASLSRSSTSAYRSRLSTGYVRQNSSYIRGGSSLFRGNSWSSSSLSRSRSRSSYSPSRSSYISPSRSFSQVKSSSSRSSGSWGKISSSRSFSGGSKSISRSSAQRSSSSRSRSSGSKVRKR